MLHMIEANWLAFVVVLLIGLVVAWWVFRRGSTLAEPRERRPDALDEGAAPARRNQALIDAPPAASLTPPMSAGTMAGLGELIAVAAQDEVEEAEARRALGQTADARADDAATPPDEAGEGEALPHKEPAVHVPTPAAVAPATPVTPAPQAASGEGDDLRRLKGVGPKLAVQLQALGITRYAQIAGWTDADIDRIDAQLGAFAGRPRRDNWVEQARLLSSGDTAGYEAKFGKL